MTRLFRRLRIERAVLSVLAALILTPAFAAPAFASPVFVSPVFVADSDANTAADPGDEKSVDGVQFTQSGEKPDTDLSLIPLKTSQNLQTGREMPRDGSLSPGGFSVVGNTSVIYTRSEFSTAFEKSQLDEMVLNFEPTVRTEALGGFTLRSEARIVWTRESLRDPAGGETVDAVEFQRGFTTLIRDFPESATRLQIGDVFARPVSFQNSSRLLGVNLARDYRAIQPRRNVLPGTRKTFLVERPSRVQIYADGALVGQQFLDPGFFDIENFSNELGTQRIELEIRDDTGRTERIKFSALTTIPRLTKGILDFGVSAGVASIGFLGGPQYDFDRPLISGFVQYGLTSDLNIGADFQADRDATMLGASAIVSTRAGSIGLRTGGSYNDDGDPSMALGVAYASPFLEGVPRIALDVEYFSENFSTISGANSFGVGSGRIFNSQVEITGSVSQTVAKNISISAGGDWRRLHPDDINAAFGAYAEQWSSYLSANFRIAKDFAMNLTLSADRYNPADDANFSAYLTLTRYFGDQYTASTSYNTRNQSSAVSLSRDPKYSIGRTFAQIRAEHINGQPDSYSLSADVDYEGNRFTAYGYHFEDQTLGDKATSRDTYLQLNTAIAFADGDFAIGRQVGETGYAIVHPFSDSPEEDVFIDDWGKGEYRAKSDILGPALVSDLIPYTNSTLEVSTRAETPHGEEDVDASDSGFIEPDLLQRIEVYMTPHGGLAIRPVQEKSGEPEAGE